VTSARTKQSGMFLLFIPFLFVEYLMCFVDWLFYVFHNRFCWWYCEWYN
jgi:hypothetical protein